MKLQFKQSKAVLVYSTSHHNFAYNRAAKKPVIVDDYNKSKCGVDQFDEMIKHFSFSPTTRCWPIKIFAWLIDAAAMNAWILFQKQRKISNAGVGGRRGFLYTLSQQLMQKQKEIGRENDSWMNAEFQKISVSYENIKKKQFGEATSTVHKCPICQCSVRSNNMLKFESCHRSVCAKDVTQKTICKECVEMKSPPVEKAIKVTPKKLGTRKEVREAPPVSKRCAFCVSGLQKTAHVCCTICEKAMCVEHRAKEDPNYCTECISSIKRRRC